jgi:hypothetical protein
VGTWAASFSWRTAAAHISTRRVRSFLRPMILFEAASATLLVIRGMEQNPGVVLVWRVRTSCKFYVGDATEI